MEKRLCTSDKTWTNTSSLWNCGKPLRLQVEGWLAQGVPLSGPRMACLAHEESKDTRCDTERVDNAMSFLLAVIAKNGKPYTRTCQF
eukprot:630271-Amphidinium_carterae.1